jgi:hypothetical protein
MAAQQAASQEVTEEVAPDMMAMHTEAMSKIGDAMEMMARPKQVVRDATGKLIGVA